MNVLITILVMLSLPFVSLLVFGFYLHHKGRKFRIQGNPLTLDLSDTVDPFDYSAAAMQLAFATGNNPKQTVALRVTRENKKKWILGEKVEIILRLSLLQDQFDSGMESMFEK